MLCTGIFCGRSFFWRWAAQSRLLLPMPEPLPEAFWTSIRKCELYVSGNIIKNVKSVIVPNTDGMKGLETAVILGVIAGDETAGLQVISNVTALQREKTKQALRSCPVEVHTAPNDKIFYIEVRLTAGKPPAR